MKSHLILLTYIYLIQMEVLSLPLNFVHFLISPLTFEAAGGAVDAFPPNTASGRCPYTHASWRLVTLNRPLRSKMTAAAALYAPLIPQKGPKRLPFDLSPFMLISPRPRRYRPSVLARLIHSHTLPCFSTLAQISPSSLKLMSLLFDTGVGS